MANESINISSPFGVCIANASIANTASSLEVNASTILAAVGSTAKDYKALDFRLDITAGTKAAGDKFYLYRVRGDGVNNESYIENDHFLGVFEINTPAAQSKFLDSRENIDPNDRFLLVAATTNTLTVTLSVRTRAVGTA